MPDRKKRTPKEGTAGAWREKQKGKNTISLREKAAAMRKTYGVKGGSAGNMSGLAARIAAGLAQNLGKSAARTAAKAAPAASRGATHAATKGSGAVKSSWVGRAQSGTLPTKTFKAAAPAGGGAGAANAMGKETKRAKPMPKKAPAKRGRAMPKKSASARRRAS